jgi:DNA-binding protein HU-beta
MTKQELIYDISVRTGIQTSIVRTVFECAIEALKSNIVKRERIYLRGFGTFGLATRKSRPAMDIKRREKIIVPARKVPYFKPSRDFKGKI